MNLELTLSPVWFTVLIVTVAAALHASFQLGISVLSGLHAHGLGIERRRSNLAKLGIHYVVGVFALTGLLALSLIYLATVFASTSTSFWWAITCGLGIGVGIAVMSFYYRSGHGTMLWLPRSAAEYLTHRITRTKTGFEAATLGMATTIAELPFILAPLAILAMLTRGVPDFYNVSLVLLYVMIATSPLVIILMLLNAGHKLSHIQRWRETNKRFLQFSAGLGLIVVSLYLFSMYCLSPEGILER